MKEKYAYSGGKVMIPNEVNSQIVDLEIRDYQDNLGQILLVENLLEELETEYVSKNIERNLANEAIHNNTYKKIFKVLVLIFGVLGLVLTCLTMMFTSRIISILTGLFVTVIPTVSSKIYTDLGEKSAINKANAAGLELYEIEKAVKDNKQRLVNLQKDTKKELYPPAIVDVDYKTELKELREYLEACYKIGYFEEKYKEYFNQGILEEKLCEEMSDCQIEQVKKYFKRKL